MIYISYLVQFGASNGEQKESTKSWKVTRKPLKTHGARRLVARDKQHKSRVANREMFTQCQQVIADGNPTHTIDIDRSTSRLASRIAPPLHKMIPK